MIRPMMMNLIMATVWLMLVRNPSFANFLVGYAVGFIIIMLIPSILKAENYVNRTIGFIRFLFIYSWAFIRANLNVAKIVLFVPKESIHPDFYSYNTSELTRFETLLISHLITLTPGTISVEVSEDLQSIIVHVLDLKSTHEVQESIDQYIKYPILRFSR